MGAGCIVHCNKVSKPVKRKHLLLCMNSIMYSVRQKSIPERFFAIFLATARNYYMKFHTFITHS